MQPLMHQHKSSKVHRLGVRFTSLVAHSQNTNTSALASPLNTQTTVGKRNIQRTPLKNSQPSCKRAVDRSPCGN